MTGHGVNADAAAQFTLAGMMRTQNSVSTYGGGLNIIGVKIQ